MKTSALLILACSLITTVAQSESPYVGQDTRDIKLLSESEIQAYLNGSGMGYAKAAELNQYPGPKHVMELADNIGLSDEQKSQTRRLYRDMKKRASELGRLLVQKERELDHLFVTRTATPANLASILTEIGRLEADIRYAHLEAHLKQRQILTDNQVSRYDRLRGYGNTHVHDTH